MMRTPRAGGVSPRILRFRIRGLTPPARPVWFALVVAITTLILVGHGCHGDDVDHEPAAKAPAESR